MTSESSRHVAASPSPVTTTALAPGFRFHPTDEELVSYYLKRKVSGKPFRVDAISEIDLYKSEPWDLPSKSRIQSRDMEWYFFCSLDRKYANRSRTNRTTGSGYWKTTGKDRSVRRNSRTVGMKKTLVFHVGRAPKGERTNWVMHEYRMEDGDMARAGVPQDAFVVCRIFQKEGPGPQNGAQYGAPLLEEEWEDDRSLVLKEEYGEGGLLDTGDSLFVEMNDFEQNQDMGAQNENAALFVGSDVIQQNFNNLASSGNLIEMRQDPKVTIVMNENIDMPEPHEKHNSSDMHENSGTTADDNDEYLELNDFSSPTDATYSFGQEFNSYPQICNDLLVDREISYKQEQQDIDEFFNAMDEIVETSEPSPAEDNVYFDLSELLNPVNGYPSVEPTDDGMVYFDAPCHHPPVDRGCFFEMNDLSHLVGSPMENSSGPNSVDELIAHFHATENLPYPKLGGDCFTLHQPELSPEVSVGSLPAQEISLRPSEANGGSPAISSVSQVVGDQSSFKGGVTPDASDVQIDDSWDKTFTKRLVSMLGSISSPPAFAAEYPHKGVKRAESSSTSHPSGSVHITAGAIQMRLTGSGKNGDVGFLQYGATRNALVGNSVAFEPMPKMSGGIMSFVLRNGFHLLFLSVLFLAASYKIGVYIYSR